jgi:hypothetical protein
MVVRARPDLEATVRLLVTDLFDQPPLRGTAAGSALAGVTGLVTGDFRRRSCCLLYRIAPPGPKKLCGDCVLSQRYESAELGD